MWTFRDSFLARSGIKESEGSRQQSVPRYSTAEVVGKVWDDDLVAVLVFKRVDNSG